MNAKHSNIFGPANSQEFTSPTSKPVNANASSFTRLTKSNCEHMDLCTSLQQAIGTLYSARCYADSCQRPRWDFAVEVDELQRQGNSTAELRWLMAQGWAEHAIETSPVCQTHRTFRDKHGFRFTNESCFILSETGLAIARQLFGATAPRGGRSSTDKQLVEAAQPAWDNIRHELRLGNQLVKKFKWRAQNQETLLTAFEEENWPIRIDDPLPPVAGKNPKRRLSDTIKCLNRNQVRPLIRFTGDGTGEGVLWEMVSTTES